jgi:phosphoribosylamine--glycine ligase
MAAASGALTDSPDFGDQAAVCVVLAAHGYPTAPRAGDPIGGLEAAAAMDGVQLYAAGVGPGLVTCGGRVLSVTALGDDLLLARDRAYAAAELVTWEGRQLRSDIAARAAEGQKVGK